MKRQSRCPALQTTSGPLRGWQMDTLDKLSITKAKNEYEELKIMELLGNEDLKEQISKYSVLRHEVNNLTEQLETEDNTIEDLQRTLNEKKELLSHLRRYISDTFDIDLLILEDEVYPVHVSHPVSCFSLPAKMKIPSIESNHFEAENYLYKLMGKKVLNPKTKNHYLHRGKYLFLKIDLSYDKVEINFAVDEIVQQAQKFIDKGGHAKEVLKHKIFDCVFSKFIIDMRLEESLELTSEVLNKIYEININADSLRRRYFPEWKKRKGISNLRNWRKHQKGDK